MATLPFLDALWLGKFPVLVFVELPKLTLAGWLRTGVAMPAIGIPGLSGGSFSPDYVLAGPYALALAYLIVLLGILVYAAVRTRLARPYRGWAWLLTVAAVIDYLLTLSFATSPGLTVC